MKSIQDFTTEDQYYEYLLVYISVHAMQGFLFQNIMHSENDEIIEANNPTILTSRCLSLAYTMVEALKNHKF